MGLQEQLLPLGRLEMRLGKIPLGDAAPARVVVQVHPVHGDLRSCSIGCGQVEISGGPARYKYVEKGGPYGKNAPI